MSTTKSANCHNKLCIERADCFIHPVPCAVLKATYLYSECYEWWSDELRYLLYRYEQHLAESQGKRFTEEEWNSIWKASAMNSIEHIHPQSKASQIEISVHRIGNLLLLPPHINSGLRDKDPEEKIQAYQNTRLLGAEAVAKTIETDGWDDEAIVGRSYEIMEWVDKTFND
ncbi:MAG: HNH endonuclease family protein [Candidatus Poribacteria bacterium]|nr:HNH endonuclease family protein [Candidatus Poribacteria bacterium]